LTDNPEDVEERCLDAEAWADELEAWARKRPRSPQAAEAPALAGLLRALAKSIRLSLFAEGSADDRGYLLEELESTLAMSRAMASGTSPPPVQSRSTGERPAAALRRPEDERATMPGPLDHGRNEAERATMPPPPGMSPRELFERAPKSDAVPRQKSETRRLRPIKGEPSKD
jgi:hypothetical protein